MTPIDHQLHGDVATPDPARQSMLTPGTVVAGRFRLVHELGRGGMGAVWLAHHTSLEVPCAVKFIHPELDRARSEGEARARFEREARAIARLRSAHVVQVLDYGTCEDGTPYLAMEYLVGEDLGQRLRRVGRLSAAETVNLVTQVARALSRAHAAGLVHRDLKPENVFLLGDEDDEFVKVLDFGVAKGGVPMPAGATKTGTVLGTPHYMSPEQAQGAKQLDHRSDLWSLGILAFRCLTGQVPFTGQVFGDILLQLVALPMPVPSAVASDLPVAFDAWWARACARNPAARFQSAKEQADALADALGVPRPSLQAPAPLRSGIIPVSRDRSALPKAPASAIRPRAESRPSASVPPARSAALAAWPAVPATMPMTIGGPPVTVPPTVVGSRSAPVPERVSVWLLVAPTALLVGALLALAVSGAFSKSKVATRRLSARAVPTASSRSGLPDAGAEAAPRPLDVEVPVAPPAPAPSPADAGFDPLGVCRTLRSLPALRSSRETALAVQRACPATTSAASAI